MDDGFVAVGFSRWTYGLCVTGFVGAAVILPAGGLDGEVVGL